MKSFVIIDGHHILYRAFHALPEFTSKQGSPTNAVYGFFSMLLKLLKEYNPQYLASSFDLPEPTFRVEEIFEEYRAQRPPMPEKLRPQVDLVRQLLKTANIPFFEKQSFEADDVIATLARLASQSSKPSRILIVSGDRDLLQLVNNRVQVLVPLTGLSKTRLFDDPAVKEKFDVNPSQIVDYKALVGDPSDNYPGVPGVGPKTAARLLNKHQTLEGIYKAISTFQVEHGSLISQKLALALAQGFESAQTCKRLAQLIDTVPIKFQLKDTDVGNINWPALLKEFQTLGFKSLIKRLPKQIKDGQIKLI